jgi:hypothetical protein
VTKVDLRKVEGLCGAGHGARNPARLNHRDGCRDRLRETRAGARWPPPPSEPPSSSCTMWPPSPNGTRSRTP